VSADDVLRGSVHRPAHGRRNPALHGRRHGITHGPTHPGLNSVLHGALDGRPKPGGNHLPHDVGAVPSAAPRAVPGAGGGIAQTLAVESVQLAGARRGVPKAFGGHKGCPAGSDSPPDALVGELIAAMPDADFDQVDAGIANDDGPFSPASTVRRCVATRFRSPSCLPPSSPLNLSIPRSLSPLASRL
jgi:hypothetical protein